MTERGTDIEFDFFDEPPTQEASGRTRARRNGPPRPPTRPPTGVTPLLRIVGLVAVAIFVIVALVFWVQSCRSDSKRDAYASYMSGVRDVATGSEQVGRELNAALTTPGIRQQQLVRRLGGFATQQEQYVAQARELTPPGRLREQHRSAVVALEFRVGGLRGLQRIFEQQAAPAGAAGAQQGAAAAQAGEVGNELATQMRRLVTSDVVWDDLFREPSAAVLEGEEIGGVEVPDSTFLSNPDLATERAMTPIWQRIRGASTGGQPGGRHGHGLVSVKAQPSGQFLQQGQDNTITATADLAFEVTVENSGDAQEVRVTVNLTVEQSPRPIEKQAVVDIINPGERKTVVFRNLGQIVQFAQKTQVKVQVQPVPGEENTANNSASYPVIFTLTPPS